MLPELTREEWRVLTKVLDLAAEALPDHQRYLTHDERQVLRELRYKLGRAADAA